ncbi:MAG: methyltransferase domain-containing protein [Oculatellaceae cyanobacterium Prado106]|jgi:SAM-dependent methyltransferase|nr:methyltransferase domain-containing protein [Oculatellaceae cyanobacterium Prado106]
MKFCKVADSIDWQDPDFQAAAARLNLGNSKNRKFWEYLQVYAGLAKLGMLDGTRRALGLGVGSECLIYAFTEVCQAVVATDLYQSTQWSTAAMSVEAVYEHPRPYRRDRLTVQHMDMTRIEYPDASFDFVWSCCAIEHVHNFQALHQVYQEIHRVLKPGGIAALTTEFNVTNLPSYEPNLLFTDQAWMNAWLTGDNPLIQGFEFLDTPDYRVTPLAENEPLPRRSPDDSIQIYCNDIILNSVSFFLRKLETPLAPYTETWLPEFWHRYLRGCDELRDGDPAGAEITLQSLLQTPGLEPRLKVRTARRLAQALNKQDKLEKLRRLCEDILPDCERFADEDHFMVLANYCLKLDMLEPAKFLFAKVEKLPGSLPETILKSLMGQAQACELQGDHDHAFDRLDKAIQWATTEPALGHYAPKLTYKQGMIQEKLGNLEMAIALYQEVINLTAPGSEFHTKGYRRLTACLQIQVRQLQRKVKQLESNPGWIQRNQLDNLRTPINSLKRFLKRN